MTEEARQKALLQHARARITELEAELALKNKILRHLYDQLLEEDSDSRENRVRLLWATATAISAGVFFSLFQLLLRA